MLSGQTWLNSIWFEIYLAKTSGRNFIWLKVLAETLSCQTWFYFIWLELHLVRHGCILSGQDLPVGICMSISPPSSFDGCTWNSIPHSSLSIPYSSFSLDGERVSCGQSLCRLLYATWLLYFNWNSSEAPVPQEKGGFCEGYFHQFNIRF